jgi:urease accessory protein
MGKGREKTLGDRARQADSLKDDVLADVSSASAFPSSTHPPLYPSTHDWSQDLAPAEDTWRARLDLRFDKGPKGARLARQTHSGPLLAQKPFYPEGPEVCHAYVLHPPGGVVGGDALELGVDVEPGAFALVTTPAATKLYRSAGKEASIRQAFRVADGAGLEWLPQETIAHNGALARLRTEVELAPSAWFVGWEIVCLGLPASGAPFVSGAFRQGLKVRVADAPVLAERALYAGGAPALDAAWGLAGRRVIGSMAALVGQPGAGSEALALARAALEAFGALQGLAACTLCEGAVLCRYLGQDAWEAKGLFAAVWERLRERFLGRPACAPRIWST